MSTIDMLVANAIREFESEFESEAGVEFDVPPSMPNYKWRVYTSTSLDSGPWRFDREEIVPVRKDKERMDKGGAYKFADALLKRLAPIMSPLVVRIAVEQWKRADDLTWAREHCRAIEVLGNRSSSCPTLRERKAAMDQRL